MNLHDWMNITYLREGTARQREAYHALMTLGIFEHLQAYSPVLAGTIPLDIDVPDSDLDIICEVHDLDAFERLIRECFSLYDDFRMRHYDVRGVASVVANFYAEGFMIEVFGLPYPVEAQNAYRHMVVEARLLALGGEKTKQAIRSLKQEGIKTEPAFAQYFGLVGDPYEAMLALYGLDDAILRERLGL